MLSFLKQFSFDIAEEASKVCLAHLFTYQDFDMGTLGLAYVGSPRANSHGGVCPKGKLSICCVTNVTYVGLAS